MLSEVEELIVYFYQETKWKGNEQNRNPNQMNIWRDHPLPSKQNQFLHLHKVRIL